MQVFVSALGVAVRDSDRTCLVVRSRRFLVSFRERCAGDPGEGADEGVPKVGVVRGGRARQPFVGLRRRACSWGEQYFTTAR